ncbi:B9 protein [Necator americanus]|uniref:B9 domain-containing protein 1 n=1 Tax=Necator americanus TaxID=51031 RepID=W2SZ87_NECAM|nr:B9 protein [Necator americanus]ETN75040.1 B9 protein [Necator americanus]
MSQEKAFLLLINGHVESAEFPDIPSLYVKFSTSFGPDWKHVAGAIEGLSATCFRGDSHHFVPDLSISATFSRPQLVFACYGHDLLGHDVVRGYGALPIPTIPGRHIRIVPCFVPEASSSYQKVMGILRGRRPEFVNVNHVARPEARHATRVTTQGKLKVRVDVILKDVRKFGFQTVSSRGLASQEPLSTDLSKLRLGKQKKPVEDTEMSTPVPSDDKTTEILSPAPPSDDTLRPLPNLED